MQIESKWFRQFVIYIRAWNTERLILRQQYPNLLRCVSRRIPLNNFVIMFTVADQYYDKCARQQHPRCPVSKGVEEREPVKWDKFSRMRSDDVFSDVRRDKLWKREERSNESCDLMYILTPAFRIPNRIPSLEYFDCTLCNCGDLLNLDKQQSTRMGVRGKKSHDIIFISI